MNLMQLAPSWLVVILGVALLAAAVEDAFRLKVSNVTVLAVIATAATAATLNGWSPTIWENFVIFALLLTAGTLLFATGKFGGGDVKLLSAVGLWVDFEHVLALLAAVFITGGLLALAVIGLRLLPGRRDDPPLRDSGRGVPYAVAIAIGGLLISALEQFPANGRDPLVFQPLAI